MKKAFGLDVVSDTFVRDTHDMLNQTLQGYKELCQHLLLEGSEWRYDSQIKELGKKTF